MPTHHHRRGTDDRSMHERATINPSGRGRVRGWGLEQAVVVGFAMLPANHLLLGLRQLYCHGYLLSTECVSNVVGTNYPLRVVVAVVDAQQGRGGDHPDADDLNRVNLDGATQC